MSFIVTPQATFITDWLSGKIHCILRDALIYRIKDRKFINSEKFIIFKVIELNINHWEDLQRILIQLFSRWLSSLKSYILGNIFALYTVLNTHFITKLTGKTFAEKPRFFEGNPTLDNNHNYQIHHQPNSSSEEYRIIWKKDSKY